MGGAEIFWMLKTSWSQGLEAFRQTDVLYGTYVNKEGKQYWRISTTFCLEKD